MSQSFLSRNIEAKVGELGEASLGNAGIDPDRLHCDVLIVGSGYGGAVAAARLAGSTKANGQPLSVWVLERGREYLPGSFPETAEQLPSHLRASGAGLKKVTGNPMGLYDLRIGADMTVIAGSGLGGSSLINANVMEVPDPTVWQHHSSVGPIWPAGVRRDAGTRQFDEHFARVKRMLGVQQLRKPSTAAAMTASGCGTALNYPSKAEALDAVASAIDNSRPRFRFVDIAVTLDERVQDNDDGQLVQRQCSHCGNCFTGCNYSAKNSLDRNYLAVARKKGAELFTGATVLGVFQDRSRASWRVLFSFTDSNLRAQHESSYPAALTPLLNPPRGFILTASKVILAAGAIGSTEILQKSRAWFGLGVSEKLGKGFSGNGDMIAFGYNQARTANPATEETIRPDLRAVGPTIVSMIDLRNGGAHQGRGPVIQDVSVPASMYPIFAEFLTNAAFLSRFERGDFRGRKVIKEEQLDPDAIDPFRVAHTQFYAVFGHDSADGEIGFASTADEHNDSDGRVEIRWPQIRSVQGVAEFRKNLRYLHAAHNKPEIGGRLLYNPLWQLFGEPTASLFGGRDAQSRSGSPIAAHPLGGCAMADGIEHGVVNQFGQLFRPTSYLQSGGSVYDSLVVLDGSIIPGSLGINPALTIAALAERALEQLLVAWNLQADTNPKNWSELLHQPQALTAGESTITSGRRPSAVEIAERLLSPAPITLPGLPADVYLCIELGLGPIRDMGVFLASAHRRLPIATSHATLTSPGGSCRFTVAGHMTVFEEVPSGPVERIARAALGWLTNSVKRRGGGLRWTKPAFWSSALKAASVIGTQRRFLYEMRVNEDVHLNSRLVLQRGDLIKGEKLFTFGLMSNPWDQFMTLRLNYLARDSKFDVPMGILKTDFSYFANFNSFLLKVVKQGSRTTALIELAGLLTLTARSIFGIHLLNAHTPQSRPVGSRRTPSAQKLPKALRTKRHGLIAAEHFSISPDRGGRGLPYPEPTLVCTRYRGTSPNASPILLLHGLTAAGNTFTSDALEYSMAAYLHDRGHDVWVAELRTSVALDSWQHPWSFDDVATRDIPALVKLVHTNCDQKVGVFAHCVGSVMFWSSVLQGKLTGLIEKAAFTQVGPATHLPPINHARSRLIGLLREAISLSTFETNPSDDPESSESLIERAFTTFPYQPDQWWRLRGKPFAKRSWEAQYHRITALHGELMNLRNVSDQVLDDLHNQIGGSNLSTYMQSLYFSRGRITNSDGFNLVTRTSLRDHVDFPCFFGSGDRNRVFEPQNAEDSALLLNEAHGYGTAPADDDSTRSAQLVPHQFAVFSGYGHQDTLIGMHSAQDVFKPIADFFAKPAPARLLQPQRKQWTAYASTMGPVVGWLRREPQESGVPGLLKVRVSFSADRIAGKPRWILALLAARTRQFREPGHAVTKALAGYWINPGGDSIVAREAADQTPLDPCRYCFDLPIASQIIAKLDVIEEGADLEVFLLGLFDDEAILRRNDCSPASCELPAVIQDNIETGSEPGSRQDIELGADQRQLWLAFIEHQLAATPVQADSQFRQSARHRFTRPEQTSRSTSRARGERDPGFNPASFLLRREALLAADHQAHTGAASKSNLVPSSQRMAGHAFLQMPELPHRTTQPALSFALASCQSMPLPFDSIVAGQSYERLANLLEREPQRAKAASIPQLLLLIGDQVYLDPWVGLVDAPTGLEKIRQPYEAWLAHASARKALRAIPTYMMLDDHEVQNEWEPAQRDDRFTADALRAFKLYQRSMGPDFKSNWYPFWPAGMPFFMLDTRTERSARNLFIRDQAQIISGEQMSALLEWLRKEQQIDPTRPKFIVSPSVIVPVATRDLAEPAQAMGSDGWGGYPKSLDQLFSFIAREQIHGVVLLQGDYHASVVTEVEIALNPELSDAVRVLSVVASGLYAPYGFVNTQSRDLDGAHEIPPTTRRIREGSNTHYRCRQSPAMYTSDPNFVVISVDPVPAGDAVRAMGEQPRWRLVVDISTDSGTLSQAF